MSYCIAHYLLDTCIPLSQNHRLICSIPAGCAAQVKHITRKHPPRQASWILRVYHHEDQWSWHISHMDAGRNDIRVQVCPPTPDRRLLE
ncbi:unnamed protein product [Prunus armeniaca]|uniref:Uncharacterized protein n=1 Tax=Prunus armeniaca TaxID=36596 RepID=A0A6J5WL38_PRUAR|nr:unnamed protein product [Prunus armeniaca]